MNDSKKDTNEYEDLEAQELREPIRPRHPCTGGLRHPRDCTCGRRRTLGRHGHRWHRREACHRCARANNSTLTPATGRAGKGNGHE